MSVIEYADKVLKVDLTCYQKELLMLIDTNPKGYVCEMISKHPTHYIRQVANVYDQYQNRTMVAI